MAAPKDPIKNIEWRNKIGAANKDRPVWNNRKQLSETHREFNIVSGGVSS